MLRPMPWDLDCADLDEVRRRVVDPALAAVFRPGELDEVRVAFEAPHQFGSFFVPTAAGAREVTLHLIAQGERYSRSLADATFARADADEVLDRLVDDVADWICESAFGWAQMRWPDPPLVAPPPRAPAPGRRVAEVYVGAEPFPVYENAVPLDPAGLSPGLVAALSAWRADCESLLDSLPAPGAPNLEPWDPAPTAAYSSRLRILTAEEAAAEDRARALAQVAADAAWREVVDLLESDRDDLVERLRAELGPAWHVPTPPRIP